MHGFILDCILGLLFFDVCWICLLTSCFCRFYNVVFKFAFGVGLLCLKWWFVG